MTDTDQVVQIPNHGPCAYCGEDVIHVYPWFTGNPDKEGSKPLHDDCRWPYEENNCQPNYP